MCALELLERVKKWYEGEYVEFRNQPDSLLHFIGGSYRRHWTARTVRAVIGFHQREWKWVIPVYVAIIGILLAWGR